MLIVVTGTAARERKTPMKKILLSVAAASAQGCHDGTGDRYGYGYGPGYGGPAW